MIKFLTITEIIQFLEMTKIIQFVPEGNNSVAKTSSSIYLVCKLTILSNVNIIAGPIKNIQNLGS